jgi:mRNA-degrading endonuclease RelE of RelBE toxin-antitoxin system
MKIKYSKIYIKNYQKIKDKQTRIEINKKVNRLIEEPSYKKRLRNILKGKQNLRIKKFRVVYKVKDEEIEMCYIKHRKEAYK